MIACSAGPPTGRRGILLISDIPLKWEFFHFVTSFLTVWTLIIFMFKVAEDSFRGASAWNYLWSRSPPSNDTLSSYIKAISDDAPRSWTSLVEEADQ